MRATKRKVLVLLTVFCMLFTMYESTVIGYATEVSENDGTDESGFTIDNTATLRSYSGSGGDITIPSTVSSIASGVFAGNKSITSVTIPASVASIGTGVFSNCTSLTSVTIQGSISSIPAQMFNNCQNLRSIYVPSSVTSIGAEAFANCVSLSGITIPSAVSSIGSKAFYNCGSLSGVSIPSTVSSIGSSAFSGCTSLTSFSVESGNSNYASSNGCLYNKAMTKLLSCPEGKTSATVASGTKIIGAYAFNNCVGIHSLTLPASVTTIEANAFSGSGIRDVTILSGVTSIGSQSSWTADIIYGESDSTAELFANSNSIVFQSLGSSGDSETESSEGGGGSGGGSGSGSNGGSSSGGSSNGSGGSGSSVNSDSSSASHELDSTPKTGDGINPIFFFCIAVLLIGVLLLWAGKRKTA